MKRPQLRYSWYVCRTATCWRFISCLYSVAGCAWVPANRAKSFKLHLRWDPDGDVGNLTRWHTDPQSIPLDGAWAYGYIDTTTSLEAIQLCVNTSGWHRGTWIRHTVFMSILHDGTAARAHQHCDLPEGNTHLWHHSLPGHDTINTHDGCAGCHPKLLDEHVARLMSERDLDDDSDT